MVLEGRDVPSHKHCKILVLLFCHLFELLIVQTTCCLRPHLAAPSTVVSLSQDRTGSASSATGSQRGPHLHQQRHSLLHGALIPIPALRAFSTAGASPGTRSVSTVLTAGLHISFSPLMCLRFYHRELKAGQRLGLSFLVDASLNSDAGTPFETKFSGFFLSFQALRLRHPHNRCLRGLPFL